MDALSETQRSVRRDFVCFCVTGRNFKVDEFLVSSPLTFDEVYRIGEQKPRACAPCFYEKNGIHKLLGDPNLLSNDEQDTIACEYLHDNYDALAELCRRDDTEEKVLSLAPVLTVSPNTLIQHLGFSPWLLRLAGNLGIELLFGVAPVILTTDLSDRPISSI